MPKLEISDNELLTLQANATPDGRKMLQTLFGAEALRGSVITRVKSVQDAAKELNINMPVVYAREVSNTPPSIGSKIGTFVDLAIVAEALNEGWVPDWPNHQQTKYYPLYELGATDIVFINVAEAHSVFFVPIVYKSEELARYAGTQFLYLYRDLFISK